MKVLSWAMSYESNRDRIQPLLDTAAKNGVDLELIGKDIEFTYLRQKLNVLRDHLHHIPERDLVVCVDSFDVLINRPLDDLESDFRRFGTKVIVSAERAYTYQYHQYKDKFDEIESEYRYVNSGTFVGECRHLIEMLDELMNYDTQDDTKIDQGLVGIYVYNWLEDPSRVRLDTGSEIVWVSTDEWLTLKESSEEGWPIKNPTTGSVPYFIHNVMNVSWPGLDAHRSALKAIIG